MEFIWFLLILGITVLLLFRFGNYLEYFKQKKLCKNYIDDNAEVVFSETRLWAELFVIGEKIPICSKCGTKEMQLWNLGPYQLEYRCFTCKKKYSGNSYITPEKIHELFSHFQNLNLLISEVTFRKELFQNDTTAYTAWGELFQMLEFDYSKIRNNAPTCRAIIFTVSNEITPPKVKHRRIPQNVKDQVWQRDKGECIQCGNNENLEFDHIIPHSKGGANTYRNIQLLCTICNKIKSDNIG